MGNIFAPEKPLKDVLRDNQRMLRKAIRELEKGITDLKSQDKKLQTEIKKAARLNQMVIHSNT